MDSEFELLKTYYEQSVSGFEREARLLFERMNFFLASMAFIIVAFATLLTNRTWAFSFFTYAVIILGMLLGTIFFVANRLAQAVALRHRDYIFIFEKKLAEKASLTKPSKINGPYNQAFSALARENRKGLLPRLPGVHTVIIPAVFLAFWATVLLYWIYKRNFDTMSLYFSLIPLLVIVIIAILGWFFPKLEPEPKDKVSGVSTSGSANSDKSR